MNTFCLIAVVFVFIVICRFCWWSRCNGSGRGKLVVGKGSQLAAFSSRGGNLILMRCDRGVIRNEKVITGEEPMGYVWVMSKLKRCMYKEDKDLWLG